jgi:FkbM family methyltransferase
MEYKSQYGQDRWIIEERLPNLKNGYFVDLAAADGLFLSNTYVLEKYYDWNGICVEPNSKSFEILKNQRSTICDDSVILDDGSKIDFVEYEKVTDYEHLLSTVRGASEFDSPIELITQKTTISLNTLLDKYSAPEIVHYISLDIEGSEIYVLQNFLPENKRKVLNWSIEVNPSSQYENMIIEWMTTYGYVIDRKDGLNGRLGHDYLFTLKDQ